MADARITVLHLVNTLEFGGVYRHVMDLADGLTSLGIRSLFAAWVPPGSSLHDDPRFFPLPLYREHSRQKSLYGIMRTPAMIGALLQRERVDILHSHSRLAAMLAAMTVPFTPEIRRLHTVHTNFNDLRLFPFYPREVIAVSGGLAEAFRQQVHFTRGKHIHTIHNGVALPENDEATSGRPVAEAEFIFVGRLVEQKGVPLLLEVLRQVVRENIPTTGKPSIRFCGGGPLAETVRQAERAGLPLHYDGFCEHPFESGDRPIALLFPSDALEGLGYVVLQAYAHGIPVIAHDLPVLRGLVEHKHSGLIVPQPAPAAWLQALKYALSHTDEMRAMGLRGKATVARLYREDIMLKKTAAVYRRL